MRRRHPLALVLASLTPLIEGGCASESNGTPPKPDSGVEASVPDSGVKPPIDSASDATYAACPDVFSGPVPAKDGQARNDSGVLGLRVLRQRIEKSREAFHRYAAAHENSYSYERQFNSVFGGWCETSIVVKDGVVQSRKQAGPGGTSWTETGADVGSHSSACHPAATAEALYDECLTHVLCQDPRTNYINLHVDARGLLAECEFFPINCADDCYQGIEPIAITADGVDWTQVGPQCCPISPKPDCCMDFGGSKAMKACGTTCDGMASPRDPKWAVYYDLSDCPIWGAPVAGPDCCGCPGGDAGPRDGGARDAAGQ